MNLLPPQKPPTPLEDLRYVILGDEKVTDVLKHADLPEYHTSIQSPFPIVLACRSDEEAARFAPLKPFIDAIAKRKLGSGEKIIAALDELTGSRTAASILKYQSKFYPVLNGNGGREGIFMTWSDVFPHFEGQKNPKIPKTQPLLIEAMKTMMLRNGPLRSLRLEAEELRDYEASLDNIFQQGAKKKPKAPSTSTTPMKDSKTASWVKIPPALPTFPPFPPDTPLPKSKVPIVMVPRSVPLFPPSSTVPEAPQSSIPRDSGPAPAAIESHRAPCDENRDIIELFSDSDAPDAPEPGTQRCASHGNAPSRQQNGADSDAMSISSDMSGGKEDGSRSSALPIFLKFRNINGGIFGSTTVRLRSGGGGNVPSLGTELDEFFDDWGFESALIYFLFYCATKNPPLRSADEFAARTAEHLSQTEAAWVYKRLKLPSRSDGRRRIYAML